jgi:small conductance mechanosensitive channel
MDIINAYIQQIPELWHEIILQWGGAFCRLILIIVLAKLALKFGLRFLDNVLKKMEQSVSFGKRVLIFSGLLKSFFRYLVVFIALMMILKELHLDLTPILAGAGIAGLAIGFGAQSFIKDVITGFFIIIEDQFSVGDYITIDSLSGIVEQVDLRSSRIRDFSGQLHIIPNRKIEIVTNFSRGPQRSLVNIAIDYEENVENVLEILSNLCATLPAKYPEITEGPTVLGIANVGEAAVTIQVVAKTEPMKQWHIERELRKEINKCFQDLGIKIPYPRRMLYIRREDKGAEERV